VLRIRHFLNQEDPEYNLMPQIYLGVILSRTRKQEYEAEALEVLTVALAAADKTPQPYEMHLLWPRAELSRLLRRLDRTAEAEEHEAIFRYVVPIFATDPCTPGSAVYF
jgi:hypothetical protein